MDIRDTGIAVIRSRHETTLGRLQYDLVSVGPACRRSDRHGKAIRRNPHAFARRRKGMSVISRILPKKRFARNVSMLIGGTVGAQAILVLFAPLLTRVYTPADFGVLAVFVSLLAFFAVIASLRYELGIPLPDDDEEAAALTVLSLAIVLAMSVCIAGPMYLYRKEISGLLNTPALAAYILLVPIGTFFAGVYNVFNSLAIRTRQFGPLARSKFSQALVTVIIQLVGSTFGPAALLTGQAAGHVAGGFSLGLRVMREQWAVIMQVKPAQLRQVAGRYRRFPLFSTWSALFNSAGAQVPTILLASLFGPAVAGTYALANRLLAIPMQLLGRSIANVFFSGAAQARREGRLGALVSNVHARLVHIGMPPAVVLVIAGPEIFLHAFGAQWRQAGQFAQWLAPWLYLVLITSPLSTVFEVLEKQAAGMVFQCVLLLVRVASILFGARAGDAVTAVAFFGVASAICWMAHLAWIIHASGSDWSGTWRSTRNALAWSVFLVSPLVLMMLWDSQHAFWIPALVTASALIAVRYSFLMRSAWL
jgi:O-antigen/teichoic acid export membrane protein